MRLRSAALYCVCLIAWGRGKGANAKLTEFYALTIYQHNWILLIAVQRMADNKLDYPRRNLYVVKPVCLCSVQQTFGLDVWPVCVCVLCPSVVQGERAASKTEIRQDRGNKKPASNLNPRSQKQSNLGVLSLYLLVITFRKRRKSLSSRFSLKHSSVGDNAAITFFTTFEERNESSTPKAEM